ncbi:MAG: DUF2793 domain-containing protein [Sphingomonadaceae bacterium]
METLRRLRFRITPGETKFDIANVLRLLAAHKEAITQEGAQRANVSAAEVRASIERKVEALRPLGEAGDVSDYEERVEDMTRPELLRAVLPANGRAWSTRSNKRVRNGFETDFSSAAHSDQEAPTGDWRYWLIMAGRGLGNTRVGPEWVHSIAASNQNVKLALIAASLDEARSVVEGEGGITSVFPPENTPAYEASLRRARLRNGAKTKLYWVAQPESLPCPSTAMRAKQAQKLRCLPMPPARQDALLHAVVEGETATPSASPVERDAWIVGREASGEWEGQGEAHACQQDGQWQFLAPIEGMFAVDRGAGQRRLFSGGWSAAPTVATATGRTTTDTEARAAIAAIVAALSHLGSISES